MILVVGVTIVATVVACSAISNWKLGNLRPLVWIAITTEATASFGPRTTNRIEPGCTSMHSTSRAILDEMILVHCRKNAVLLVPITWL